MPDFARSADPAVQAELDRLHLLSPGADVLGLDRITRLLDALGNPERRMPPAFHVAGTNGKGSTCALLRSGLEAAGHSVHVFTSPHLVRFNERIRMAGTLIADDQLAGLLREVRRASGDIGPSFFEATTAAAFLAFSRHSADACIVEVGLGGRLDATNVLDRPLACGIASVGRDHEQFLGADLVGIAAEKAGIARAGVPLVSLAQPDAVEAAIIRAAAEAEAPLLLEGRDWNSDPSLVPALPGAWQVRNANLAWQMLKAQQVLTVTLEQYRRGLAAARWPARFQRLGDGPLTNGIETWVDGAHNPDAAKALAGLIANKPPMHLVLGTLANKNAKRIVEFLAPHAASLTFVPVPDHPHHEPAELVAWFGGRSAASLEDALAGLPAPRLIVGSLYLAGEALALNEEYPD